MADFKYAVKNGDNILGLMWNAGNGREVFVTNGDKLDLNHSLIVINDKGEDIKEVEVIEMLSEILPR